MTNKNNGRIKIIKEKETRNRGISRMINEGGLGAEKYYNIKKETSPPKGENRKDTRKDE